VKNIYCEKCAAEITDKNNLVIATYFFYITTYHDQCYSRTLKGRKTLFVGNEPINGFSGNLKAILAFVLAMILFLDGGAFLFVGIVALLVPIVRLYAWFTIERHLE
jgi:hypothetical protein